MLPGRAGPGLQRTRLTFNFGADVPGNALNCLNVVIGDCGEAAELLSSFCCLPRWPPRSGLTPVAAGICAHLADVPTFSGLLSQLGRRASLQLPDLLVHFVHCPPPPARAKAPADVHTTIVFVYRLTVPGPFHSSALYKLSFHGSHSGSDTNYANY